MTDIDADADAAPAQLLDIAITGGPGFPCSEDDTLLRAALRAGLGFPYECNTGSCGTCRYDLVGGAVLDLRPDASGLTDRDRERGRRLACQSRPVTPCTVKVRLNDQYVPRHRPQVAPATLRQIRRLTHDLWEFTFTTPTGAAFIPGQYALLDAPGVTAPRGYSMSNLPNPDGDWEFIVKRVAGGAMTGALFDRLAAGDCIHLDGPYGLAYMRPEIPRDVVCVGGGSGLAPMVGIARGLAAAGALADRELHFFYGCRGQRDMCGTNLLAALPGPVKALHHHIVLSEPATGDSAPWCGPAGFVHDYVRERLAPDFRRFEYYLAGPPPMVQATLQALIVEGKVSPGQIHYDKFY